ncbi:hypothetical protein PIB30_079149 [Stylosanthes scabra]|uniref:Uncharacterized protein n=1 Tax=Stylosanthes scabra TaxID=79078 RepID=A0ABU6TQL7_9FABA|nr:hypothetical protein [Stylosanthes scabra]
MVVWANLGMVKDPLFIDAETRWCVRTGASGAYVLAPNPSLGVPPKAIGAYALALGCVLPGSRNGLLGFACDLFIPLALFSHFRSELCLLKPETLERKHQGIVQNGKRFKTRKALGSHRIPAFLDLPFISSINIVVCTYVIIKRSFEVCNGAKLRYLE